MIQIPKCSDRKCIHYIGVNQSDGTEMTEKVICEAFPNGIPSGIAYGDDPCSDYKRGLGAEPDPEDEPEEENN